MGFKKRVSGGYLGFSIQFSWKFLDAKVFFFLFFVLSNMVEMLMFWFCYAYLGMSISWVEG